MRIILTIAVESGFLGWNEVRVKSRFKGERFASSGRFRFLRKLGWVPLTEKYCSYTNLV
ncbi:hypothetical protein [Paenibacillus sp. An7]|uniref:hypothetical protein n=1 Tax=Paenibacillus sp. An7 TaxID=2689577 RepID=UPI00135C48EA|nr:hypothetical protein [Paenibacillus sp. An7]